MTLFNLEQKLKEHKEKYKNIREYSYYQSKNNDLEIIMRFGKRVLNRENKDRLVDFNNNNKNSKYHPFPILTDDKNNQKVMIIGSKPYTKLNLNNLIDNNFDNILRINFATPNNNNGTKKSTFHYMNCHLFRKFLENSTACSNIDNVVAKMSINDYKKLYPSTNDDFLKEYIEYCDNNEIIAIHKSDNNTENFKKYLKDNDIDFEIKKELRCGTGAIFDFLKTDLSIIGFSLINNCKSYYNKNIINSECHDIDIELKLLKLLHNHNKLDLTFCLLQDKFIPTIDYNFDNITPTIKGITSIFNNYRICVLENFVNHNLLQSLTKEFDIVMKKHDNCLKTNINSDIINDNTYPIINKLFTSDFVNDVCKNILNEYYIQNIFLHKDDKNMETNNTYPHYDKDRKLKFYLCLNDMGIENGCFKILPNSIDITNKQREKDISKNVFHPEHTNYNNTTVRVDDMIPIIAKAGTLIIFDTNLIHCGGDNFEKGLYRKVIRLHVQKTNYDKPLEFW